MAYKYITSNNLYEKQTYMYSKYEGAEFIKEYIKTRKELLNHFKIKSISKATERQTNSTHEDLSRILVKLEKETCSKEIIKLVNMYVKSFEVRKRIYTNYDSNWKPLEHAGFEDYDCYLLFANCLLYVYKYTKCLKYYSCLLKVDDTILSVEEKLYYKQKEDLYNIVKQELNIFYQLAIKSGICWEIKE